MVPDGHDADASKPCWTDSHVARHRLGEVEGKIFRIGHLGDFNDLMLAGTLSGG